MAGGPPYGSGGGGANGGPGVESRDSSPEIEEPNGSPSRADMDRSMMGLMEKQRGRVGSNPILAFLRLWLLLRGGRSGQVLYFLGINTIHTRWAAGLMSLEGRRVPSAGKTPTGRPRQRQRPRTCLDPAIINHTVSERFASMSFVLDALQSRSRFEMTLVSTFHRTPES